MNSLKVGIFITSTTEGQVERKLELVLVNSRSASNVINKLNTIQESGVKSLSKHRLYIVSLTQLQRGAVQTTLLYVRSGNGGSILVLGKGSASSLVGRTISTNVVIRWSSPIIRDTGPIPSVCRHNTFIVVDRRLPERHDLHTNSINLHLVKQLSNGIVLRNSRKHAHSSQIACSSALADRNDQLSSNTIFQAESSKIPLTGHAGKLQRRRTTSATETRTPVPSVGTTSRATITTVNHSGEWC